MQMLYNSENFAVVKIDVAADAGANTGAQANAVMVVEPAATSRGGYEIVDKFARKEIFLEGEVAMQFKAAVDALVKTGPSEDDLDELIGRYTAMAQQPLVLH